MLGRALASSGPPNVELIALSHEQLDITRSDAVASTLNTLRPHIVINASGFTAVDRAETERAEAFAVNATAVAELGSACKRHGVAVVHFGTDYVFDGASSRPYREDDPARPINYYGETKLAGEQAVLASGAKALVIRTQWLFGAEGSSFARTMWERARRREHTRVVDDQRGRPTCAADVAHATWRLIDSEVSGLCHLASSGDATWYDVARQIFGRLGVPELLVPCETADLPRPARRPAYSVLDTTRAESLLGSGLPAWPDALGVFLEALPRREAAADGDRCA